MKKFLLLLILAGFGFGTKRAEAQSVVYYPSDTSIQRYNVVPSPAYRHYEDVRRYNAAPRLCATATPCAVAVTTRSRTATTAQCQSSVKIRTELVSQRCQSTPYYDANGCRHSRTMTVSIYKDIYSCGRSRIWQHISY